MRILVLNGSPRNNGTVASLLKAVTHTLTTAHDIEWIDVSPKPLLDDRGKPLAGGLSEKIRVNINGVEQGMFIRSRNARNPVLLYLHGGMPDYFLTQRYPTGLEEIFTVVWWEQHGSGLSYRGQSA